MATLSLESSSIGAVITRERRISSAAKTITRGVREEGGKERNCFDSKDMAENAGGYHRWFDRVLETRG